MNPSWTRNRAARGPSFFPRMKMDGACVRADGSKGDRTMPHVTFIHGIANKPPKEKLLEAWESSLANGGLDLGAEGVTTSMVYWADMLYPAPLPEDDSFESVDAHLGTDDDDEDLAWIGELRGQGADMVTALRDRLGVDKLPFSGDDKEEATAPADEESAEAVTFEAIPLPWFIKRRIMKRFLKDVHHYLFNVEFSPRPGETFRIQTDIRKRFLDQLAADKAANADGRHIVVSHSMGTVISYDCLKNVDGCPPVDAYMTVGCPLGISEVHDNFDPTYRSHDAFPSDKVQGRWVNVYDRLDPVAFDARISNDYKQGGNEVITDQRVHNSGKWRHSSHKYYGQAALTDHIRTLLDL